MRVLKLVMLTWCRDVASTIWRRRHPGRQMQLPFPLPLPEGPAPVPDWLVAFSALGEVEADDPDEPTKKQVDRMLEAPRKTHKKRFEGPAALPSRCWRDPEPLGVIVAEGRAARARLLRTLRVPAAKRYAEYSRLNEIARAKAGARRKEAA